MVASAVVASVVVASVAIAFAVVVSAVVASIPDPLPAEIVLGLELTTGLSVAGATPEPSSGHTRHVVGQNISP